MQKSYKEIEKNISSKLDPIYLFYGEEEYLISTLINKIKRKFGELILGINYILIDDTNIEEFVTIELFVQGQLFSVYTYSRFQRTLPPHWRFHITSYKFLDFLLRST